ncbi:MAG: efflux RND transporter periplasmic adaptor subunit [Pelotomaculaceae bacterium]|jgi:HlyD family secretion protein|uniref:Macrolide export protein MacA n=1 Tax=anaerobic digester metagenome TaxID=1263854 RepID=A0A485M760_9ZZZZ|nr:efflux RND transporter periplasmic adaptor subunit [Bacillota bacterium]HHU87344.1 efflux RND transporter periplasmic adaptor subunit [Peptococcaceae bacterium]
MKRKRKVYLIGAIILAGLAATAMKMLWGGQEVMVLQVRPGTITRSVTDSGYVQPAVDFDIHATQSARVAEVLVETGQAVKAGQVLVTLENLDLSVQISDMRSQLSQAQTAAQSARAALERTRLELVDAGDNLKRMEELYGAGAVSRAEYEKAVLQVETCRQILKEQSARLDSALAQEAGSRESLGRLEAKEGQLVVKSPADGTVLDLPVKREEVVGPMTLVATVAAAGQLEVKADILSDDLGEVKIGQKAVISAPVLGQDTLTGEVKKIYPRAEEKQSALGVIQRRVPVIITLPDPGPLKPGYEVRVAIETRTRDGVLVLPREAVRTTGDGQREVSVVVKDRVEHRPVQTGLSDQVMIEITGGLEEGDVVVRDGGLELKEKTKVKPVYE